MTNVAKILAQARANPRNISYAELTKLCEHYFGQARNTRGSHAVYKDSMAWRPASQHPERPWQCQGVSGEANPAGYREIGGETRGTTDTARYTFRVTWSVEDQEFVATCVEFGALSWLAATPEEALVGLRAVVDEVVADMQKAGEIVPEPLAVRHYSGKFQLRLGADLHRRLAIEAAEQHVSLNQYIARKLAAAS